MAKARAVESLDNFFYKALKKLRNANPLGVTFQAYLESAGYSSELAREAHNFCGLKAKSDWTGPTYEKLSDEDEGGDKMVSRKSPFRAYATTDEFLADLDRKIQKPNYAVCASPEGHANFWVYFAGLVQGGWATDRAYFKKLVDVAVSQLRNLEPFKQGWRSKLHISFQWARVSGHLSADQVNIITEALKGV